MRISLPSSLSRRLNTHEDGLFNLHTLFTFFLWLIFFAYWFFVWQMERIDLEQFQRSYPFSLPIFVTTILSFIHPRVLRHLIPVILGWLLAYEIAANLLFHLFEMPSYRSARAFLFKLRVPIYSSADIITVTPQTMEILQEEAAHGRAGGPGQYIIPVGHAAVTGQNGCFSRTLESGLHALNNFEYIHAVFDLRPQHRRRTDVQAYSKEGLAVTADIGVTFRISTNGVAPTPEQPFPCEADAIRKIAYGQLNLANNNVTSWENYVLVKATDYLQSKVMAFSIDELLKEPETEIGTHFTIHQFVERETRKAMETRGVEIIRLRIGRFNFPEEVTKQHITYWSADRSRALAKAKTEGEAAAYIEKEVARAEAEMDMIKEIVGAIREAKRSGHTGAGSVIVALRLIESLERVALKSQTAISVPDEMLHQLQTLHQQLLVAGGEESDAGFFPPGPPLPNKRPLT